MARSGKAREGVIRRERRYEQDLWSMADALRGSMDAAEYKHVVLGLPRN